MAIRGVPERGLCLWQRFGDERYTCACVHRGFDLVRNLLLGAAKMQSILLLTLTAYAVLKWSMLLHAVLIRTPRHLIMMRAATAASVTEPWARMATKRELYFR